MITASAFIEMDASRKGKLGETICENVMKASGVSYIPLCKLQMGGAPMAIGANGKTVLPDFDVMGDGVFAYLDAKLKTQSIRWKKTGQVRHGINLSNWQSYLAMGIAQRKECGLFLIELLDESRRWSGSLMSESFVGLGEPTKGFNERIPKVYWPRNRFAIIGAYSPDQLLAIANGDLRVDMAALLKTAFGPPPPRCESHADRSLWYEEVAAGRRGWIKTTCRICGAFIGFRPP